MRRVQFILKADAEVVATVEVPGAHIPTKGDEYLLHTHGSDDPERWVVAAVVRELWPGPSDVRLGGRPLKVVDEQEYHEGDTVVVVLESADANTAPFVEDGALNAAIKTAGDRMREHSIKTQEGMDQYHLMEWLKELRTRRIKAQANGEPPPYDPSFGDDKLCRCGHTYYRHFDTYEDMAPVGCKYCGYGCDGFEYDPNAVEK